MLEHELWLKYAADDLKICRSILKSDEAVIGGIVYHAQQSAEKSLKAYLLFKDEPVKRTHDLLDLLKLCINFDESFRQFWAYAIELNPYISSRYPDSYTILPDISEAEYSYKKASEIYDFVRSKI